MQGAGFTYVHVCACRAVLKLMEETLVLITCVSVIVFLTAYSLYIFLLIELFDAHFLAHCLQVVKHKNGEVEA